MSYRNTDETSFNVLMPSLDESAVEDEAERIVLTEFKECLRLYESYQLQLQDLQKEMREATGDYLKCLKNKVQRLIQRIDLEDKILVALKKDPFLNNLYKKELTAAKQRQSQKDAQIWKDYLERRAQFLKKKK